MARRIVCPWWVHIGILPLSPLLTLRLLTPPRSGAGCRVEIWVRELELLRGKNEKLTVETEEDEIPF